MTRTRIVTDVRSFASFVSSLWGLVTVATVAFAIFNGFLHLVPINSGHASLATALAALVTVFALVYSFSERLLPIGFMAFRNALGRLGCALGSLAVYLILLAFFDQFYSQKGDFAGTVAAVIGAMAVITYATFFGLLTAAFGALAVIEYTSQPEETTEADHEALG